MQQIRVVQAIFLGTPKLNSKTHGVVLQQKEQRVVQRECKSKGRLARAEVVGEDAKKRDAIMKRGGGVEETFGAMVDVRGTPEQQLRQERILTATSGRMLLECPLGISQDETLPRYF